MTGLLVSVRSAAEALEALAGGVDVLDIKEPDRGALGRAPLSVWEEVRAAAADRAPLSAALGELLTDSVEHWAPRTDGLQFAKIGLAGCGETSDWRDRWRRAVQLLAPPTAPVAVMYADWRKARAPSPESVLRQAVQIGCTTLLVDTWSKRCGDLFHYLNDGALSELLHRARSQNIRCVLGGSLRLESIQRAVELGPDLIAVRGAACGGDRTGDVERRHVAELAARIATAQRTLA